MTGIRTSVVVLVGRILLHRPDVWPVDGEQDIAVDLQMVRAGDFRRCDESDRLGAKRIAHVHDGISVAEHMPDKGVTPVQDDLERVRPPALVATRHEADIFGACAGQGSSHAGHIIKLPG